MHGRALIVGLLVLLVAPLARAQPCPGVPPWAFADISSTDAFCGSITFMATSGVTTGCQVIDPLNRLFCPDAFVTRRQMAGFMDRLADGAVFAQGGNAFGAAAVLGTADNQPVEIHVNGGRVMRYMNYLSSPSIVGGYQNNSNISSAQGATVAGGGSASMSCRDLATGARTNSCANHAFAFSVVGGGVGNVASSSISTIAGGDSNFATGSTSTVAGGSSNTASGNDSTVAGGANNTASGRYSTVAGGANNTASGFASVAMGYRAKVLADGAFSFADNTPFDFNTFTANSFRVRATGGVRFVTDVNSSGVTQWSCVLLSGSGWTCSSDRSLKHGLLALDGREVLEKLAAMPVYQWQPNGRNAHVKHYGPMAQDFHAAFGLGDDDTMIGTQDADGVALAAIQGLNAKVEQREAALRAEVGAKDAEIAALRERLQKVEDRHAELRQAIKVLMARSQAERPVAQAR